MYRVQNTLLLIWHLDFTFPWSLISKPTGVGFCSDIYFSGGLLSNGILLNIPQTLICKYQGESKLCSLFCSLYIPSCTHCTNTRSALLAAAEAQIPRKCMPLSQHHHLPHSYQSLWPPTAVFPFSTTPLQRRHLPPATPLCRNKMKGHCAFPHSGPTARNSLPIHIRNARNIDTF